jgi:hypothetical protein
MGCTWAIVTRTYPTSFGFTATTLNAGRIPGNSDSALVGQVIDGIRSVDGNHLHTILLGRSDFATNSDVYANEDTDFSSRLAAMRLYIFRHSECDLECI